MKKAKWFKRIVMRFRKKTNSTNENGDKKRYLVIVVDQKAGEVIENEQTDAVFGVILKERGPEYMVSMNAALVDITSMVMKTEELIDNIRQSNRKIRECERDILQRAKENNEKRL